jgi:hypothetical protein
VEEIPPSAALVGPRAGPAPVEEQHCQPWHPLLVEGEASAPNEVLALAFVGAKRELGAAFADTSTHWPPFATKHSAGDMRLRAESRHLCTNPR